MPARDDHRFAPVDDRSGYPIASLRAVRDTRTPCADLRDMAGPWDIEARQAGNHRIATGESQPLGTA